MLRKKPEKRIAADQILSHEWFKIFQSEKFEIKNSKIILENFNKYHVKLFLFREVVILCVLLKISYYPDSLVNHRDSNWPLFSKQLMQTQVDFYKKMSL